MEPRSLDDRRVRRGGDHGDGGVRSRLGGGRGGRGGASQAGPGQCGEADSGGSEGGCAVHRKIPSVVGVARYRRTSVAELAGCSCLFRKALVRRQAIGTPAHVRSRPALTTDGDTGNPEPVTADQGERWCGVMIEPLDADPVAAVPHAEDITSLFFDADLALRHAHYGARVASWAVINGIATTATRSHDVRGQSGRFWRGETRNPQGGRGSRIHQCDRCRGEAESQRPMPDVIEQGVTDAG